MKKIISRKLSIGIIMALVMGAILFTGYHLLNINKSTDRTSQISRSLSLTERFHSIQELQDRAELIALVSVKDTRAISAGHVTFTISKSELTEIFKGSAPEKTINILETGGLEMGKMVTYDDNAVMQKNDQAIVFLERYHGDIVDDAFVVLGVYQGKFLIDNDEIVPPNGVSSELESITNKNELLSLIK